MSDAQIYRITTPYDRFVLFMRYVLVTVAGICGIMSILWPLFSGDTGSFSFNQERMERGGEEVRIVGPTYRGTDAIDRLFVIEADEAIQSSPDAPKIRMTGLRATLSLDANGREALVTAEEGVYDTASQEVTVPGLMHLETSDGYRLDGFNATLDLEKRFITSARPVDGVGPLGQLSAGRFTIDIDRRKAVFEDGVKMYTIPKKQPIQTPDTPNE